MSTFTKIPILTLFTLLCSFTLLFAQSPSGFNYQAVARDAGGNIMSNQNIDVKFIIKETTAAGPTIYEENHVASTNQFGLFNLIIGDGTVISGIFNSIDWRSDDHFLRVDIDAGSGYVNLGTEQLQSVPYSLFADKSMLATDMNLQDLNDVGSISPASGEVLKWDGTMWEPASDNNNIYTAGSGITIGANVISNIAPDQTVVINDGGATTVTGSYPIFSISSTDNVNDADSDPSNEIQNLSLAGTNLSLSGSGGTVSLSPFVSPWTTSGSNIYRTSGNIGIGTTSPVTALQVYANRDILGGASLTGNGAKLIWDYSSRAFRAGYAAASSWNEDSIGLYSAAFGFGTVAKGYMSFGMGFYSQAQTYAGFAIGRYNVGAVGTSTSWASTDPLFEVGNGTSNANRNNAFTIRKDGRIAINDATPDYLLDIENSNLSLRSIYINHDNTISSSTMYGIYVNADNTASNSGVSYAGYLDMTNNNDDAYGLYSLAFCDAVDGSPAYAIRTYVDNDNGTGWAYGIYGSVSGSTTGSKYAGYFNGNVYTTGSYLPSDEKLKRNITTVDNVLSDVMKLKVRSYTYNTELYPHMVLPEGERVGFVAQNVSQVMPGLTKKSVQPATTPEEEGDGMPHGDDIEFDAVDYVGVVPYLVKAIQEQQEIIDELKARVEQLESKIK